jgi:uncharacterized protein (DUF952 family)
MERMHEWEDADYVGCLAYRAHEKIEVTHVPSVLSASNRAFGAAPPIDMCALFQFSPQRDGTVLSLVEQAGRWHRRFPELWALLHAHMGQIVPAAEALELFSASTAPHVPLFVCNYWVATPVWMKRYCAFMQGVKHLLDTIPYVQQALWSDAEYPGSLSAEQLLEISGQPHYTYHSFLCERLACFFFFAHRARMVLVKNNKRDLDAPVVLELRSGADVVALADPGHSGLAGPLRGSQAPSCSAGRQIG